MASISGTFVADGESAVLSDTKGNLDLAVKHLGDAVGSVVVLVSYDSGTTFFKLEGGDVGPFGGDRIVVAGGDTVQYKLRAVGVTGSIYYFLGA